jgi:antitoxin component YwqK of YwqJK toxin-antitoxin module
MMYFGEIKGKEGDGEGILYENNKLIFKGSVKNTQRHGHGVLYKSKEKLVENSEWKNNRLI